MGWGSIQQGSEQLGFLEQVSSFSLVGLIRNLLDIFVPRGVSTKEVEVLPFCPKHAE